MADKSARAAGDAPRDNDTGRVREPVRTERGDPPAAGLPLPGRRAAPHAPDTAPPSAPGTAPAGAPEAAPRAKAQAEPPATAGRRAPQRADAPTRPRTGPRARATPRSTPEPGAEPRRKAAPKDGARARPGTAPSGTGAAQTGPGTARATRRAPARTGRPTRGAAGPGADGAVADDPTSPHAIGRRVLRLRTEQGLTQRQLAEPAYTAAYVSTLEAGRVRPSETALRHLAERLGISPEELATGRSPQAATELRLGLTDARRTLTTGAAADAAGAYAALLDRARHLALPGEQATALVGLGDCALEGGELGVARERFEEAERLLAGEPLPRRVPAIRGRATAHLLAGELRYACYLLESALDELNASGLHDPDALLLLYTASIAPYMDMGAHARAAQAAELALALAPRVADPVLVAGMHRGVARTLIAEGRIAEADASLAKAQELYQQLQIHTELAHCHWMRGYVHAQDGDLARAEDELRVARDMLASKRAALFTVQVEVELADVLRRRGKTAEAEELLRPLLATAPTTPRAPHSPPPPTSAPTVPAPATSHPLAPGTTASQSPEDATAAAPEGAAPPVRPEEGAAGCGLTAERGAVHAGGAHRLLGLIAEERGDTELAEEHYCAALSLLERTGAAGDLADLCRLLGDLLRRTGRVEAAMDAYRTGLGHRAAPGTTTLGPAPTGPPVGGP